MICEICGKKTNKLYKVIVDGAILNVCEECKKYGKEIEIKYGKVEVKQEKKKLNIPMYEEEVDENFSKIIKEYREKNNLTQEEMAKKLGIKFSLYKALEEGKIKPTLDLAKKIEKILGIKLIKRVALFEEGERKRFTLRVADIIEFED